jgi:spermidine synthase
MELYQRDQNFTIRINGQELMQSRQHESERELARLGCAHLTSHKSPNILIGGLGMGYTLRQALDMLGPGARITVGELMDAVVKWNREFFGALNGRPVEDVRVEVRTEDIVELILKSNNQFDAILLDIDNGPNAMTDAGNFRLYGPDGILACRNALRDRGCMAVWSADPSKQFEKRLMSGGFHLSRFRVPAYKESKSESRFIWLASEDKKRLPLGGSTPRPPKGNRKKTRP